MGSAATSSKIKKKSGEDRRKRKNKSRKRRRVSSSPSSYSSDSDDVSRPRPSSRRKSEKRRGRDPKRSTKKKRRKARHRSVSSASRDSGSSSERSRSPHRHKDDRKGKFKKVKIVRKLDEAVRSLRSRNMSPSCFTCSDRDSRSKKARRKKRSNRESEIKEWDGSRQVGSSFVVESRGDVEEMYETGSRKIDNEFNMANYDELPRANAHSNVERADQDSVMASGSYGQAVEIDRWMCESNLDNDSYVDQFEHNGAQTPVLYNQLDSNSDFSRKIRSEIVGACKHDPEADDLELMLRKKALENLSKLRGGLSLGNKTIDEGDESSGEQPESAKKVILSSESDSIIYKQRQIEVDVLSEKSNLNDVNKLPPVEPNYSTSEKNMLISHLNESGDSKQFERSIRSQNTSNLQNITELSPEKMSNRQSPCKNSPEKNAFTGGESDNRLRDQPSLGDGLSSGNTFPNGMEKIVESNETVKEYQSGSQFEKKTFSRMHDGEMVQVSYKVYIPNKTPALARRRLQR